jgi:phthalate 4,5-dioxygenase
MLSKENNELLCKTGPGTPGGDLMRSYWQPAALSRELKSDEPLRVRLLGEDLVMFRDAHGKPQLISRFCPHRRTDLSYGRVEENGIRCIYHGWLIDGRGRCMQRPAERDAAASRPTPPLTDAYPCHEAGGLILAYMGKGAAPDLPRLHFLQGTEEQTFVMKVLQECNYLQGNEGNLDPAHLSFLHIFLPEGVKLNLNERSGALNEVFAGDSAPEINVSETPYGLRIVSARTNRPGHRWVRITNFLMPNAAAIHGSPLTHPRKNPISENCGYQINWHVPIDDVNHWKYVVAHRFDGPVDKEFLQKGFDSVGADFVLPRNRENLFKQDREEMRTRSFAGLGPSFFVHDKCVIEAQGGIIDRSQEHLGSTDTAVVKMRKQLLSSIAEIREGRDPLMVDRNGARNSLEELTVLSVEMPADADLTHSWWKEFFEGGKPKNVQR